MNSWQEISRRVGEESRLLPSPSDEAKYEAWKLYHLNQFWCSYTGSDEISCPVCRSSNYSEEEKDLGLGGVELDTVNVRFRCNDCGRQWRQKRLLKHKYEA